MMNFEILEKLNIKLSDDVKKNLLKWEKLFLEYNSHTNLMSKNDTNILFEKHVYDSLAINLWEEFKEQNRVLDVGTGGGFPSVILAVCFPEKQIIANDSRIKKINFIKEIKRELSLDNLEIVYSRIEEADIQNVDLIVSRAVGKMLDIYELSKKHLKKGGKFLIYKSKTTELEIKDFQKKYKNAQFKIIQYELPLKENFERSLVVMI